MAFTIELRARGVVVDLNASRNEKMEEELGTDVKKETGMHETKRNARYV